MPDTDSPSMPETARVSGTRGGMKDISWWKLFWLYIIAVFTLEIILATFFSLRSGILDTFPYLYILPIILLARSHPRFAIYFTIILGWIYLGLVYFFMPFEIKAFATSIAWFYIFVTIGVVISSLAESGRQEQKLREMLDNSLAGIFTFDKDVLKIVQSNHQAAVMLGYTPQEMEGLSLDALWWNAPELTILLKKIDAGETVETGETGLRKKDGGKIWALLTVSTAGSPRIVCSAIDITDKKEIKDELIESELRYHMLFDSATDAIIIHDPGRKHPERQPDRLEAVRVFCRHDPNAPAAGPRSFPHRRVIGATEHRAPVKGLLPV